MAATSFLSAQDYNYEFITVDTLHLSCRVIKQYDNLKIISNQDFANVMFDGKISFVGRKLNSDLVYNHFISNEKQYWVIVNPSDGIIYFKDLKSNLIASYGTRLFSIPITNDF